MNEKDKPGEKCLFLPGGSVVVKYNPHSDQTESSGGTIHFLKTVSIIAVFQIIILVK